MKKQLKINKSFAGYKAGQIIDIQCDDRGNPLDSFWFARVRDSRIDACVEFIVVDGGKKKSAKKNTTED